ncbi:tetratricopeptide repeat protein [Mesorhizobium sp. B2-4-17]|uniref:tetratricopeptide repeat protein n=1 Tax=Mesorhizobium sp. B2-4-17 TaxID=2589932 RepID=UPI00112E5C09|nr:tetratricopeptide repeat protein [Mesorhizobium sp. B2-4-17]TPK91522.1 sel1 repeat family protein [Mesorhizobium sp. B2-4-17]
MIQVLSRHALLWSDDKWYRLAWVAGPQAVALLLAGWLIAVAAHHTDKQGSAWGVPLTFDQLDAEMRAVRDQAVTDKSSLQKLLQLAKDGRPVAQFYAGTLYDPYSPYIAFTKDVEQAQRYYEQAAEKALPAAEYNLAFMLMAGTWNPIDLAKGCQWARRSAEHGWVGGQRLLGICYRDGSGGTVDKGLAFAWFMRAAQQGDNVAQAEIMSAYARGEGIPRDEALAFQWGLKAGDAGNAFAQEYLGEAYLSGKGTRKDEQLAKIYLKQAANKGNERAQALLASMPKDAAD